MNSIIASLDANIANLRFSDYNYFLKYKDESESKIYRVVEKFIQKENKRVNSKRSEIRFQDLLGSIVPIVVLPKDGITNDNDYDAALSRRDVFAYGASRRMSKSLDTESRGYKYLLTDEEDELVNATAWLMEAEYLRTKGEAYEKKFNIVYTVIETLFRDEAPGGILFDTSSGKLQIKLCTHYGAVLLSELSLGYKTLIAWMVDFAKGLFDRYSDSEKSPS